MRCFFNSLCFDFSLRESPFLLKNQGKEKNGCATWSGIEKIAFFAVIVHNKIMRKYVLLRLLCALLRRGILVTRFLANCALHTFQQ